MMLTTSQAAAELGVTPQRVRKLIADGRLKSTLFGRDRQISPIDLASVAVRPIGRPRKAKAATYSLENAI